MNLPDYTNCTLCPRMCHVNRNEAVGYCGCTSHLSAARAALHKWEEPVRQRSRFLLRLYFTLLLLPEFCSQQRPFWQRTDCA